MTTSPLDALGLTNTASSSTTTANKSGTLDQADFLKLMTAQLNAQDPLSPMDNQAFVAQMAQFSSVAGITEMNTTLKSLAASLTGQRLGDAANLIGHNVLASTSTATPLADGSYAGEVAMGAPTTSATLTFSNASGQIVHTQTLGANAAGSVPFTWNGKDDQGNSVTGPVKIAVSAIGASGTVDTSIATWSRVSAVQSASDGSASTLVTPLGNLSQSDAIRIS